MRLWLIVRPLVRRPGLGLRQLARGNGSSSVAQDLECLRRSLGAPADLADDLAMLEDHRAAGTCRWFTESQMYTTWEDSSLSAAAPVLWLSGNAASGKSTICSYVVQGLQEHDYECCYFFFKHGSEGRSTLMDCLKSLAYQGACQSESSRNALLRHEAQGTLRDLHDERVVWRRLFQSSSLEKVTPRTSYWVIDGLDECCDHSGFFRLMSSLPGHVRVLVSSRTTRAIERGFLDLGNNIAHQQLEPSKTADDIRCLIDSAMGCVSAEQQDERPQLRDQIMLKSSGSFLWVRLVLQELEHAYSEEAVEAAINDLPPGMTPIYHKMLARMADTSRTSRLARSVLSWTICASRPLLLDELQMGVRLDIGETLCNPTRSIQSICDQFLVLDSSSRVQLIHETAREYLTTQELVPEFIIRKREANFSLAIACLRFLTSDWFKKQHQELRRPSYAQRLKMKNRSSSSKPDTSTLEKEFATYACFHFSEHVYKSRLDTKLLDLLGSFLEVNVFPWVEYVASKGDLSPISRAAVNLKRYLEKHVQVLPSIDGRICALEAWTTDLILVAAKFRPQLLAAPNAIHSLIPALCSSESIIWKSRLLSHQSLAVIGFRAADWDDCITRIDLRGSKATTAVYGEVGFAIGLVDGRVYCYSNIFQERFTVNHGERVKILCYSLGDRFLISAGRRSVQLWDLESQSSLWTYTCVYQPLAIAFMENDEFINIALQSNKICTLRTADGLEVGSVDFTTTKSDGHRPRVCPPPSLMAFSDDSSLLAISSRGQSVKLFDVNDEQFCLACSRNESPSAQPIMQYTVDAMAFNPNPDIAVLVVSYGDGELTVFSLKSGTLVCRIPEAYPHSLACAPDGRCLVTASTQGAIQIYDFGGTSGDQLYLTYQIDAADPGIRALAFASDGLRFLDIRATQCRIWEPDFLVRRGSDGSSHSDMRQLASTRPRHKGVLEVSGEPDISAIHHHSGGKSIFCGTRDGSILAYSAADAQRTSILRGSAGAAVVALVGASTPAHDLVSADEAGYLSFMEIEESHAGQWSVKSCRETRMTESITRLVFNEVAGRLLAVGTETLSLWTTTGERIATLSHSVPQMVISHPTEPRYLLTMTSDKARIFNWTDLTELSLPAGIRLLPSTVSPPGSNLRSSTASSRSFLVNLWRSAPSSESTSLECWPAAAFRLDTEEISAQSSLKELNDRVEQIIDMVGNTLLFLDHELWVCSIDLAKFGCVEAITRHFFVPSEWRTWWGTIIISFNAPRKEFAVAVGSRLVVVQHGLGFSNKFGGAN